MKVNLSFFCAVSLVPWYRTCQYVATLLLAFIMFLLSSVHIFLYSPYLLYNVWWLFYPRRKALSMVSCTPWSAWSRVQAPEALASQNGMLCITFFSNKHFIIILLTEYLKKHDMHVLSSHTQYFVNTTTCWPPDWGEVFFLEKSWLSQHMVTLSNSGFTLHHGGHIAPNVKPLAEKLKKGSTGHFFIRFQRPRKK